ARADPAERRRTQATVRRGPRTRARRGGGQRIRATRSRDPLPARRRRTAGEGSRKPAAAALRPHRRHHHDPRQRNEGPPRLSQAAGPVPNRGRPRGARSLPRRAPRRARRSGGVAHHHAHRIRVHRERSLPGPAPTEGRERRRRALSARAAALLDRALRRRHRRSQARRRLEQLGARRALPRPQEPPSEPPAEHDRGRALSHLKETLASAHIRSPRDRRTPADGGQLSELPNDLANSGGQRWTRTSDLLLVRETLSPAELVARVRRKYRSGGYGAESHGIVGSG